MDRAKEHPAQAPSVLSASMANPTTHNTEPIDLGYEKSHYPPHSIAIVGMAGRFPGADTVDKLWDILLEGRSVAEPADVHRLQLPEKDKNVSSGWWGNFLSNSESFDNILFEKSSREALAWDPQQRVLLEVAYTALQKAGHFDPSTTSTTDYGCFIGAAMNNYQDNVSCHTPTAYATVGTSRPFLSGSISHHFNWTGPSLTIDTACSSSLVAVHTACRAIWSGECTRALAGGTNIITSPHDYQNLAAAGFLSPTGQSKPFDAAADGYCRGEGVGVVLLKSLTEAIDDKDPILGVIVGSAANQNYNTTPITVPNAESQTKLFQKVMKLGNVRPGDVTYIEAHGTGTGVGDPVEAQSIRLAFAGKQRDSMLHFGSIKGNIGHTEASAGVAGLIKVLLMLEHGVIPPQASHTSLNPQIPPLEPDNMAIPKSPVPWNTHTQARLACVNSYGAAGSNSALLIREAPKMLQMETRRETQAVSSVNSAYWPLILTAATSQSLSSTCEALLKWIEDHPSYSVASLIFNLGTRCNQSLPITFATSIVDFSDLKSKVQEAAALQVDVPKKRAISTTDETKPVILVFAGQERDFVGLNEEVYMSNAILRNHLDLCDKIIQAQTSKSIYPAIFDLKPIENLEILHCSLFALQYASAQAWVSCGLKIDAVVGHSFGQFAALATVGAFSLDDAIMLVAKRALLIQNHWGKERGGMLYVGATRAATEQILQDFQAYQVNNDNWEDRSVEIACYNAPSNHVLVTSNTTMALLEQFINSRHPSVPTKRLQVTHGFHSRFADPIVSHLQEVADRVTWLPPKIHIELCNGLETNLAEGDPTLNSKIPVELTRKAVFFHSAISSLERRFGSRITWLEAGCGSSVMQLVKLSSKPPSETGHLFLSPKLCSADGQKSLVDATISLWKAKHTTQHWPFHRCQANEYSRMKLPTYPFQKANFWLPYIRDSRGGQAPSSSDVKATEEPLPLISFLRLENSESAESAVFCINGDSERYQNMANGHVMAGQPLAPASLYFEMICSAAFQLEKDILQANYVPRLDDLQMEAPLGTDTSREVLLMLTRMDRAALCWRFSIKSSIGKQGNVREDIQTHTTGVISLVRRDDTRKTLEFKRYEALTGLSQCEAIGHQPNLQMMQGSHIYKAFKSVVNYSPIFHRITRIACAGNEATADVTIPSDEGDEQSLPVFDAPMIESFMQIAGFLINYFHNQSETHVQICNYIERIEIGPGFHTNACEWVAYSNTHDVSSGNGASTVADVYLFDLRSKSLVMVVFGCRFSSMPRKLLASILQRVNKPQAQGNVAPASAPCVENEALIESAPGNPPPLATESITNTNTPRMNSNRRNILAILAEITDVAVDEINDDHELLDLGIDSLMATEILNHLYTTLGITIHLASFLLFPNIGTLIRHIDSLLGGSSDNSHITETPPSSRGSFEITTATVDTEILISPVQETPNTEVRSPQGIESSNVLAAPTALSAAEAFENVRHDYDKHAERTRALHFWSDVHPELQRLVLAYAVEALSALKCNLSAFQDGEGIQRIIVQAKDRQLMDLLYDILVEGKLISRHVKNGNFLRTAHPIDLTSSESIYQQICNYHCQHDTAYKLLRAVGSSLAQCLAGEQTGLQVLFGVKETKKTLEAMYEFWPLFRSATLLVGEFLLGLANSLKSSNQVLRILEVGGGTAGTTRYVVDYLRRHGIAFEYVFTDISTSLVAAAKKEFGNPPDMRFQLLDLEDTLVPVGFENYFHCIIGANCVHATANVDQSLRYLRKMVRDDGALCLVEITKRMYWLDMIFGVLDGWWRFNDGRSHALMEIANWEQALARANFGHSNWSEGNSPESQTVRVIAAFPTLQDQGTHFTSSKQISATNTIPLASEQVLVDTVAYKRIGEQELLADIYHFARPQLHIGQKMPIGMSRESLDCATKS